MEVEQSKCKVKVKVKVTLEQVTKAQRWSNHTLSLTSTLDWGGLSTRRPGHFTPVKVLYTMLSGPQSSCGRVRKISPPLGFDPRTIHLYMTVTVLIINCGTRMTCGEHHVLAAVLSDI
jgi:hypothetical protein